MPISTSKLGSTDVREMASAWLENGSQELEYAWARIKAQFGDTAQLNQGEVWQYVGSWKKEDGIWKHCFRHRWHPDGNRRLYCGVPASAVWTALAGDEPEDESLLGPID